MRFSVRAMQTRLTLQPGQSSTKALVEQYGDRLVCVRYRYDAAHKRRVKTVELIVEEVPWEPRPAVDTLMALRVGVDERRLQQQIKQAGGRWWRSARCGRCAPGRWMH